MPIKEYTITLKIRTNLQYDKIEQAITEAISFFIEQGCIRQDNGCKAEVGEIDAEIQSSVEVETLYDF